MADLKPDDLARPLWRLPAMPGESVNFGFTAQQDAAIRLRVPISGVAWLDAMIREARRWDMATKIYAETRALSPQDCIEEAEQVLRRLSAPRTEWGGM